jgi:outer membrane lipoprotein-sorting protein
MKYLRTVSTSRLLALLTGAIIAVVGGTAIAVAASSGGPVPAPSSLADAVHTALSGSKLTGFSADITFTNHLIPAANLQGSDPLLSGASGRLWFSPDQHRLRIELQSNNGDAQILVDQNSFWISDPRANIVYKGTLPASSTTGDAGKPAGSDTVPSITQIQSDITKLFQHLNINGVASGQPSAIPGDVSGQPTYSVRVTPRHDGGLLGAAEVAWDAVRGVPLDFAVYASNSSSPVLELQASNISYGPVAASDFAVNPPAGAKVVTLSTPSGAAADKHGGHGKPVRGLTAVASSVPFKLAAPDTIAGLPRQTVAKLDWGGTPAAVVTYGQGVGGIAVIQRAAGSSSSSSSSSGSSGSSTGQSGLSLPSVSINGNTAHELATALGTVLMFDHAGVSYTVIGSVPPTAAELAATDIAKTL